MNRLKQLFQKKEKILSIYFTAGYPHLKSSEETIIELEKNGVDLIEVGIPFSDPLADGAIIQKSSEIALKNGMSLEFLLKELDGLRDHVKIPLVLMGYFNSVMQFGIEKLFKKMNEIGLDGIILPDMPLEVYESELKTLFEKYQIHGIFLITPSTSEKRIRRIDKISKSFIYMVSSASTTGVRESYDDKSVDYFKRIKSMSLKAPILTGFGISSKQHFDQVCEYSDGGIIGSAFIKSFKEEVPIKQSISSFVSSVKK